MDWVLLVVRMFARLLGRAIGRRVTAPALKCPSCGAAVAAGAAACARCGTPLGAALGVGGSGAVGNAAAGSDPVQSSASWAIGLSVAAVPLCCAPLSIVGAILGFRTIRLARDRGQPTPARAIAAVGIAAVYLVAFVAGIAVFTIAGKRHKDRVQAVRARLAGKRDAATIDRQVACDLVEEQLLAGLYEGSSFVENVTCAGSFEAQQDRAMLRGVEFTQGSSNRVLINACLAHSTRWFALKVTASDEACPPGPWAASGATTEAQIEGEEDRFRREEAERSDRRSVEAYTATLARVHKNVSKGPRVERACPSLDLSSLPGAASDARLKPPAIDLDFLGASDTERPKKSSAPAGGDSGVADWSFLTATEVRTALDSKGLLKERAATIGRLAREGGPYLIVYRSERRAWPEVGPEQGYGIGLFEGWMILVDLRNPVPLCQSRFAFRNSAQVKYDKRGPSSREERLGSALRDDLVSQFHERATEEIKKLSQGKLRLGYKFIE